MGINSPESLSEPMASGFISNPTHSQDFFFFVKDLRFELELIDFKEYALKSRFKTFLEAGTIKAVIVKNADLFTRKKIDDLTDIAKTYGAKGLAWFKVGKNKLSGGISKFFDEDLVLEMIRTLDLSQNDILFIVADSYKVACSALGAIRIEIAKHLI